MSKTTVESGSSQVLPPLNTTIKEKLEKRKFSSFKLCSQLGIPHAQFAAAIKLTNFFPRDPRLFDILASLDISHDPFKDESSYAKLQERYTVQFKRRYSTKGRPDEFENLPDLLKSNQDLPPSVYKSINEFSAEVEYYFSLFDAGDVFVYTSLNLLPFEMSFGDGIISCAKQIAKAVKCGARFVYMFPRKQLLDNYALKGCAIESYPFASIFNEVFLKALKENLPEPDDKAKVERQVLMLEIDDNPFFAFNHKFAVYKVWRKSPPVAESYCMGLVPFGRQDNAYILPLNQEFMRKFSDFITWQLDKAAREQGVADVAAAFTDVLAAFRKS